MSREPLPPRPEKESFDVSEAPREPSTSDGLERRVADRTVDGSSPLQRALAGLTTAGEWAAQAEAEERASAELREPTVVTESDDAIDLDSGPDGDGEAGPDVDEVVDPTPRERARHRKAEAREARRADKEARRGARKLARQRPEVEAGATATEPPVLDEQPHEAAEVEAEPGPRPDVRARRTAAKDARREARRAARQGAEVEGGSAPAVDVSEPTLDEQPSVAAEIDAGPDDAAGAEEAQVEDPRPDTRERRTAAKHARRAAALERRQARAEAKVRRGARRGDAVEPSVAEQGDDDVVVGREPDEIDRELAADDATTDLAAVAAAVEAEERLEAGRLEDERADADRREAEHVEAERLEAERLAAEQLIAEELEAERLAVEQAEVERAEAERAEAERVEAERIEAERLAAAAVVAATPEVDPATDDLTLDEPEPEIDWEDVERRAAEAAVAVSARAAAREQKASERRRKIEAKAAARLEKDRARRDSDDPDDVPEPPDESKESGRPSAITVVAAVVGAGGLILSVVLAVGAMLAALGTDSGALYTVVSAICDALTAPIGSLVDFTGSNAAQKEALVAWGLGSIVYLAIGLGAQSVLRSRTDDD